MQIKRAYTKEQSRRKIVEEKYRKVFIVGLPNDLSEEEAKRYEEQGSARIVKVINVEVKTLTSILEKYNKGVFPDFLSLDVEGWDYQILESLKEFIEKGYLK